MLLLGKAIWGKQGLHPLSAQKHKSPCTSPKLCRRKTIKKRVGRRDERAEQLPGTSPHPLHAKNDWLWPQGISAFCSPAVQSQLMPEAQTEHQELRAGSRGDIFASIHQHWQGWNSISFQLCFLSQDTNLSFWARPAGAVIMKFLLLFSPLPFSTQSSFYGVHDLWWAGWCFLQKFDKLILNFITFLHRKTPTITHRQLCQSGSCSSSPTHLSVWDPLCAGSLWVPFKDKWLSPSLWCLHGACSSDSSTASVQAPILHPWGSGCRERHPRRISYTKILIVWLLFVFMWKQDHWKHFNSRQSICGCLWNSWFCSPCADQFPCRQTPSPQWIHSLHSAARNSQ